VAVYKVMDLRKSREISEEGKQDGWKIVLGCCISSCGGGSWVCRFAGLFSMLPLRSGHLDTRHPVKKQFTSSHTDTSSDPTR
jgi:hypothetical protein